MSRNKFSEVPVQIPTEHCCHIPERQQKFTQKFQNVFLCKINSLAVGVYIMYKFTVYYAIPAKEGNERVPT